MRCKKCEKFYKDHPLNKDGNHVLGNIIYSSPVECAFDTPDCKFNKDNWSCRTMVELRELSGEDWEEKKHICFCHRDDLKSASLGIVEIPEAEDESIQQGYLIMTWYKSRGQAGQAWVMWDEEEPELLTLRTAEFIIKELYERKPTKTRTN